MGLSWQEVVEVQHVPCEEALLFVLSSVLLWHSCQSMLSFGVPLVLGG